jgi:hypothetical protein
MMAVNEDRRCGKGHCCDDVQSDKASEVGPPRPDERKKARHQANGDPDVDAVGRRQPQAPGREWRVILTSAHILPAVSWTAHLDRALV